VCLVGMLLLAGCGRFGFGEHSFSDAGPGDGFGGAIDAPDGPMAPVDVKMIDAGLPPGLVVWLPLDDTSAASVADVVSGFGGTCTGTECPTSTAGHHGNAFLFDGTDDCIVVANMGQFGQAQITLAAWVRQDVTKSVSFVSKPATSVSSTADSWQLETLSTGELSFTTSHGSMSNTRIMSAAGALPIGSWHHIAATFDGATKVLYLDGAQLAAGAQSVPFAYDVPPMYIGCDDNNGTRVERVAGAIDDVQLYNRALTPAEIQMLAAM